MTALAEHPPAEAPVPACWDPPVVMISAGHGGPPMKAGAPVNDGNLGVHGQREAVEMLALSLDLAERLEPHVRVVLSRQPGERVSYDRRLERLHASGAVALIELHSDTRCGDPYVWADSPWGEVYRCDDAPGFTVLYEDRNALGPRAASLARSLAEAMVGAGLTVYTGGYGTLYDFDEVPGVYRDRRGLKMLGKPQVPAVIIETHSAIDWDESLLWREPETHARFAHAVLAGLVAHLPCGAASP